MSSKKVFYDTESEAGSVVTRFPRVHSSSGVNEVDKWWSSI